MVNVRQLPPDLQDRYGVRRTPWWGWALITMLVVGFVVSSAWLAWTLANPPVRSKLLTWSAPAPDRTVVTWEVRRNGSQEVTCVIRVADNNRHDVGYAVVTLPPGDEYVQPTYDVRTRAGGRVVELLGCKAGGTPAVPAPEFPPGTENPAQPWTP